MNIIITNVGRRGYLVNYFKTLPKMSGKVFVSDCNRTASGLYGDNDGYFILPKPVDNEKAYVDALIKLCMEHKIDVVVPVIDPEIFVLAKFRGEFKNKGITVVVSDERVLNNCFDKLKMNKFLDGAGIKHPKTYSSYSGFVSALDKSEVQFPVVIKPILGSGSVDTYFADNEEKVKILFSDGMIIQEKLEGVEYGADTFNSFDGEPLRCVIKRKISMRSGETDKSVSAHNKGIEEVLLKLSKNLKHVGNLDADVIVSDNNIYVIDLNPRFGGGYPATHAIGVNLVDVLYRLLNGEKVEPEFGNYRDNILVMKEISVRTTTITDV